MNVNQTDIDNRLLAGDVQVDSQALGVQAAARAKILANPTLKANSDDPLTGFAWFAYINTKVAPLTNLACRKAVEYAADKQSVQTRLRRPGRGRRDRQHGDAAARFAGYQKFDLYNALSQPTGDLTAAKQQLQPCGQPNGFTTSLAYRSDRPTEIAAAPALQPRWPRSGIKATLQGLPDGQLLHQLRGRAEVRALAQHRHRHGRLGPRLAGRLRLPRPARRRGHHRPGRQHQHRELNDPVVNNLFAKAATHHRRAASGTRSGRRSTSRS